MPRKKATETPSADFSNSKSTGDQLRQYIEVIENLQADAKAVAEDIKERFAEAKGAGFDTKVMRKIIAERKRKEEEVAEEEAILEIYRAALGMSSYGSGDDAPAAPGDDSESMV